MTITAIIEDSCAFVVAVVIDDHREHRIDEPIPRSELRDIGSHIAELAGYTVDCDTLQLTPINATSPQN